MYVIVSVTMRYCNIIFFSDVYFNNVHYVITGNALDDLHLDEPLNLVASIDRDFETDSPTVSNSISAGLASSGKLYM